MFISIFAANFNPLFYIAGAFLSPNHFQNIAAYEATSTLLTLQPSNLTASEIKHNAVASSDYILAFI
jgi:hypothetical protein